MLVLRERNVEITVSSEVTKMLSLKIEKLDGDAMMIVQASVLGC